MNDHKQQLEAAMLAFNKAERTDFMLATAARWLGLDGPTYLVGDVRVKAFFEDIHGRHWADAALAVESLYWVGGVGLRNFGLIEGYRQAAADIAEARDLWVCTDVRGKWNAVMTPVTDLADAWGYPPPVRLPDGDWARTWLDLPERTDDQELAWIAHGGSPLHNYRAGSQL